MGYEPYPLTSYREQRNRSHKIKFKLQPTLDYSSLRPTSRSHHLISQLDTGIHSDPVNSSQIGRKAAWAMLVACCLWMYCLIGQRPMDPSASATGGYYHSPFSVRRSVITVICRSAQWWKPSNNFSITPVTTQLFLPYSSNVWTITV